MNPEETRDKEQQYRVAVTQGDIREIKRDVTDMQQKVNELHTAFVGSTLSKDGGILKRIEDLEIALEENKQRIDAFEVNNKERMLYIKWIWGIGGALGLALITIALNYIFHVKK